MCAQPRSSSRSASGMPSMSEITWNGQREREVAHDLQPVAARDHRVERGVDDLLDAGRELLDRLAA